MVIATFDQHVDTLSPGVLGDVIHRFLCDAIEVDLDLRSKPFVFETDSVKICLNVKMFRPLVDEVGQCNWQPEFIERGRP